MDKHSAFTFRNGRLTIEGGVIALDFDIWDAIRRHYHYHKLLVGTLCYFALFIAITTPIAIVFDPGYVIIDREQGLTNLVIFLVPAIIAIVLHKKQSHITLENSIALERVDYVQIRPAGQFKSSRISIVYDDAAKIRNLYTNFRGFGETHQYEQAKQVFEANELEVREE